MCIFDSTEGVVQEREKKGAEGDLHRGVYIYSQVDKKRGNKYTNRVPAGQNYFLFICKAFAWSFSCFIAAASA